MLKKIAKRVHKEITQAFDYMEQAFVTKDKNASLAELFAMLSEEELVHAEKLLREGKKVIESHSKYMYDKTEKSMSEEEWEKKCQAIWEWECRLATDEIGECRFKLSKFKSM